MDTEALAVALLDAAPLVRETKKHPSFLSVCAASFYFSFLNACFQFYLDFYTGSMRTVPIPESPSPPPPPPPRPSDSSPNSTPSHSQKNQSTNSANDSKESNELSEAECDRDPLIKTRNSIGGPPNMSTEEMRRLLEK